MKRAKDQIDVLCEHAVAAFFRSKGRFVIPTYEYSHRGSGEKAPMTFNNRRGLILPDLDVFSAAAGRNWFDVKHKSNPHHQRNINRLEHGIDKAHYLNYTQMQKETVCRVWIAVVESSPLCNCKLPCGRTRHCETAQAFEPLLMLRPLTAPPEPRFSDNKENDLVSWPRDSFKNVALLGGLLQKQIQQLEAERTATAKVSQVRLQVEQRERNL